MFLEHMHTSFDVSICRKSFLAKEALKFLHMLCLDVSVQRIPVLIHCPTYRARKFPYLTYIECKRRI